MTKKVVRPSPEPGPREILEFPVSIVRDDGTLYLGVSVGTFGDETTAVEGDICYSGLSLMIQFRRPDRRQFIANLTPLVRSISNHVENPPEETDAKPSGPPSIGGTGRGRG